MASQSPGSPQSKPSAAPSRPPGGRLATPRMPAPMAPVPQGAGVGAGQGELGLGVAVSAEGGGVVTARRAGGLRDMALGVDPNAVGLKAALQNLAKSINVAFQSDYGENYLEAVYQAAIVRKGVVQVIHKDYFGFGNNFFGRLGMLLRSVGLTFQGPDPASPEGQKRITERGPSSIRGLFSLLGRKMDLVAEFEDRVPAYVEQMFDRLEASGIIEGWDRDLWEITTTRIGLNILIRPAEPEK